MSYLFILTDRIQGVWHYSSFILLLSKARISLDRSLDKPSKGRLSSMTLEPRILQFVHRTFKLRGSNKITSAGRSF